MSHCNPKPTMQSKSKSNPLGGRPLDEVWKDVIVVNQADNVVTCKKCGNPNVSKRIDRIKIHMKKCKGEGELMETVATVSSGAKNSCLSSRNLETSLGESTSCGGNKSCSQFEHVDKVWTAQKGNQQTSGNIFHTSDVLDISGMSPSSSLSRGTEVSLDKTLSNQPSTWPISSTPRKEKIIEEAVSFKRMRTHSGEWKALGNFIQTTSPEQLETMQKKWAAFFYKVTNYVT